jgi:Cdc6-like AAA superfamily ATPase
MAEANGGVQPSAEQLQDVAIEAGRVFTPSAPIDERALFAGRDREILLIVDAVYQKGRHAILFGERGVGKTSLANVLPEFLERPDSQLLAPRITCDSQDTFDSVWRKVFNKIELQYDIPGAGFAPASDKRVARAAQLLLPDNAEERLTTDSVRRALTILSQDSIVIVIIDEFDILAEPTKKILADSIKTLSDDSVPVTILLVGVADGVGELIKEHQSVQRAIEQVKMPRMSRAEIMAIIDRGLDRLGMTIDAVARQRIALLSRGLPHYTHLLSLYAARHAINNNKSLHITDEVVEAAVRRALDATFQTTREAWHLATMSPRKGNLFAKVLLSCALAKADELGYFAAQDVRAALREITGKPYEIANFSQHLSEFCEVKRGFILQRISTKRKYRFRFADPSMQPFVILQGLKDGNLTKQLLDQVQELWD